jgi:REP element-mobilizing transposase RayT
VGKIERFDEAQAWHHVMNRGIAHRTVIENGHDARMFLAFVARAVARDLIEVHAYCLMTTHFHLLVRSTSRSLSAAMQLILHAYVLCFNRTRQRDGSLFRGRFRSRRIDSSAHWANVIRYIDANAAEARIVQDGEEYPYCSRFHYARPRGPIWLSRKEVEREVCEREGTHNYSPDLYESAFARGELDPGLVLRRLERNRREPARFDDLVGRTSQGVQAWMLEQAQLADGTRPGSPVASAAGTMSYLDSCERADPNWRVRSGSQRRIAWPVFRAGLLRFAAGLRHREIADRLGCSLNTACRWAEQHKRLLVDDPEYRSRAARALESIHFNRQQPTTSTASKKW